MKLKTSSEHSDPSAVFRANIRFWDWGLKVQTWSKLDETYFVVCNTKCTSTHIKESSWVTIWIWKIKIHKHINLLSIGDLEIFLRSKGALHSNLRPLFEPLRSWIRSWSKNKVCCTPLKIQLLLKVKLHIWYRNHFFILVKAASH